MLLPLESEFERQLYDAPGLSSYDLPEVWRVDVVVRQLEIHVVEDIEELCTELQVHPLVNGNIFDGREIPLLICRALHGVASHVPKLADSCMLKCSGIKPAFRRPYCAATGATPSVRVANNVRPAAEEPGDFRRASLQRRIAGIVNRKRRVAHKRRDTVHLPVSEDVSIPILSML